jgi:hypothetical protein
MLKQKQIVLGILGLALSHSLYASDKGSTAYWDFSAAALYLQPSFGGNGLGYSTYSNYSGRDINRVPVTINGAADPINNLFPDWGWGFYLGGAYHVNSKNNFTIEWYHLNETTSGYLPQGSLFSGSVDGFYAGYFKVAPIWNAVNLELGHLFALDDRKNIRLHGGLQYASIKNTWTNYPRVTPLSNPVFVTNDTISYSGVGPRFGVDFSYTMGSIAFYAKPAMSLLVGSSKQAITGYQNYSNSVYGLMLYGTPNYNQTQHNMVVAELEAKLGIQYDYTLPNGKLTFDVGYLWINYLRSLVSYTGIGIVGSSVGNPNIASFDLNGVCAGLKWTGNWL